MFSIVSVIAMATLSVVLGVMSIIAMLGGHKCRCGTRNGFSIKWVDNGEWCIGPVDKRRLLYEIGSRFSTSAAVIHNMVKIAKESSTHSTVSKMKYHHKDAFVDVILVYHGSEAV